jgi:Asp-tRNA(Asn)/Glu-tRNA(Gln) amidotransferase A subunit family amidase
VTDFIFVERMELGGSGPRVGVKDSIDIAGHPALTLPIAVQGLPAGLQLVGRAHEDEALCALAAIVVGKIRRS